MRVFCPVHKKGFSAPRRNPIRCENRHHVLGELDFEGRAKTPVEVSWEYCCNCEHFWPSEFADERCPVCDRQISARYLCDRCYTFSLESPSPVAVKNFTLTPEGAPQPSCPGCLQEATDGALPHEHLCDYLGVTYTTAFRSCPFCEESIGAPPSFPASTADHLSGMWSIKKVSQDYERDMLVEAEDGEFVLIPDGNASHQPILIPAITRFVTKQEFYEHYQDYYHCESPSAGDVIVIEPAVVEKIEGGWRLGEAGRLEVQPAAAQTRQESFPQELPVAESGPVSVDATSVREKSPVVCPNCGATVERENAAVWHFCWKCGEPLDSRKDSSRELTNTIPPDLPRSEQTPSTQPPHPSSHLSILEPTLPEPDSPSGSGSAAKLLIAALVGLAFIGALIWLALRFLPSAGTARVVSATSNQAGHQAVQSTDPAATPTPNLSPEDYEWLTFRGRVESALPTEKPQIVEGLRSAEQKYPADYRFPYERAKLSIKGVASHDEAFAALLAAAQRAMNAGQAKEMLSELMAEKATYFRKTSRGHDEWNILVEALKNENRSRLQDLAARLEEKGRH